MENIPYMEISELLARNFFPIFLSFLLTKIEFWKI